MIKTPPPIGPAVNYSQILMKVKNFVLKMIKPDAERIIRSPYSPYEEDGGVLLIKLVGYLRKWNSKRAPMAHGSNIILTVKFSMRFFQNGKPEGSITMYYDNGQVFRRGEYKNG